jgi:hypothetical protein
LTAIPPPPILALIGNSFPRPERPARLRAPGKTVRTRRATAGLRTKFCLEVEEMAVLTFYFPVLKALEQGAVIRKAMQAVLLVAAVLVALSGLLTVIAVLKFAFQMPSSEVTIGGLLLAVFLLAAFAAMTQILWYRSSSVREIPEGPYTVVPIFSLLLRTVGELYATMLAFLGLGGCLFIWLTRTSPLDVMGRYGELLPDMLRGGTSFLSGITFAGLSLVFALLALVFFYFLAETSMVLVDIAIQLRQKPQPQAQAMAAGFSSPSAGTAL